jgi:hypothetical protein
MIDPECEITDQRYELLIQWEGGTGFDIGNFESGNAVWNGAADAGVAPTQTIATDIVYTGFGSLQISWTTGATNPRLQLDWLDTFIVGKTYVVSAWIYVPTGSPDVQWHINHLGVSSPATATKDSWIQHTYAFTATAAGGPGDIQLRPASAPAAGQYVYIDDAVVYLQDDDIWHNLRWTSSTTNEHGRDQLRSLSPPRVGNFSTVLDNAPFVSTCGDTIIGDYWPANESSPIAGMIIPARKIRYRVNLDDTSYTIFYGYLDDYSINVSRLASSVSITGKDSLELFSGRSVSTALCQGVTTGQAISCILDAIDWPADKRVIDPGAGVIPFFWAETDNAWNAMVDVMNSEGPPALLYVDEFDRVVFKDRHHRITEPVSLATQMTITDNGMDPKYSFPLGYEHGWRDVVNSVTYNIDTRAPTDITEIWTSSAQIYSIASGASITIKATAGDPFFNAITPVLGTDYTLITGSVSITLSRTSGISTEITITAAGTNVQLTNLRLRGISVPVSRTTQVSDSNATSIAKFQVRTDPVSRPWLSVNEAIDMANLIVNYYGDPLTRLQVSIQGYNTSVLHQQLARKLSHKVRVTDSITGVDSEFFTEQIGNTVRNNLERRHVTTLGLEAAPAVTGCPFILNQSLLDVGQLGGIGVDDPAFVFTLAASETTTRVPPGFLSSTQTTSWETSASTKSVKINSGPGDTIVVIGATADGSATLGTPTGNGLTYTLEQSSVVPGEPALYVWSTTDTAGCSTNWTLTVPLTGSFLHWGFIAYVFRNSDGVGNNAIAASVSGEPSLVIATASDNASIVVFNIDANRRDGTQRLWRDVVGEVPNLANGRERLYTRGDVGERALYSAYYIDAGSAGNKTVGLSLPLNQLYTIVAIEVQSGLTFNPCGGLRFTPGCAAMGRSSLLDTDQLGH